MPKGKCKHLDYKENLCMLDDTQCEGKEDCGDYEEEEK